MEMFLFFFILVHHELVCSALNKFECGYKQCPQTRDGALNVHIITHSHMDAGWVKTFDEYYYGTRTSVSTANVQLIYHSILSELLHDKRRKFTFSETAYFWRWWKEQRPVTRATFRTMVQEGRIEFAGGGWVQNDEATLDYQAIIDLYTWGLRKLNDTLGPCGKPKAAWQIDSYGHTREQTSLLAQMGYDGLFIGRVDHKEREAMIEEDRMEFMWRGNDVLGKMSDIMTHTLFNLYNPPEGFCFDFLCNDEPIMDDPDSKVFNADKRVSEFISEVERQAKYYDHDNILVMMGGDFTYQSAASWFMNIDKLINHVNSHPANMSDVNIFYSTPSCYLKALYLYGRRDKAIYTEKGDHVPYGSDAATYWTGYYTSRPSLKYFFKKGHAFLQVVKQLTVVAGVSDTYELHLLRHAVALLQHHDAITGTSQQHVANDFARILSEAIEANTKKISGLLSYLTPSWGGSRRSKNHQLFVVCHQLNISQCRLSETQESFLLLLYNPSSTKTYHYVRLPAVALNYAIKDLNDDYVEYQLVPLHPAIINLPGRRSTAIQEIFFEAENIPPLGYSAFYITAVHDILKEKEHAKKPMASFEDVETTSMISNEYLKVSIDRSTGLLESIQHVDGVKVQVSQNFFYYSSGQANMHSGAYSFRPTKNTAEPVADKVTPHMLRGPLVKEIRQRFSDWLTQTIRLYRGEEFVEFEWVIGPVPVGPDLGKEVVTRFTTNITNNGQFYTDSNGRQMMKRTCWNESASHQEKKPKPACYFPVTSRICIHSINTSVEMCVLNDRAQGGTSYNEGEVELMVHRRLLTDDGFGLEEPLNEEAHGLGLVITGKHRVYLGNYRQEQDEQSFAERVSAASRRWKQEPWAFLTSGDKISRRKWSNVRNKRFSALRPHALPRHIEVLTLEPWKGGSVLLRLENTMEKANKDYAPSRAHHTTIDLRKVFSTLQIRRIRETTLAANQWLDEARQMDWSTRYVYSGGNDGIAAEDNIDYDDNKSLKETSHFFDEDKRFDGVSEKARRTKEASDYYSSDPADKYRRRKRSTNTTVSIQDNLIIRTAEDILEGSSNESHVQLPRSLKDETDYRNGTSDVTTGKYETPMFPSKQLSNVQRKRSKSADYALKEMKEMGSEEEEFMDDFLKSNKGEKRGRFAMRRKGSGTSQPSPHALDDDVTKSIYDMYYKGDPYVSSRKTVDETSSEEEADDITRPIADRVKKTKAEKRTLGECSGEDKRQNQRKSNGRKTVRKSSASRRKGRRQQRKGRPKNKSHESSWEDARDDWSKESTHRSRVRQRGQRRPDRDLKDYADAAPNPVVCDGIVDDEDVVRRKRSSEKGEDEVGPARRGAGAGADGLDEAEAEDHQFLVTLRPTQIRTFVLWLEKKALV